MPEASATLIGVGSAEAPARLTYLAAAASLVGEGAGGRAGARLTTPQFIVPEDSRQTPDEAALADLPALEGDWTSIEQADDLTQTHLGAKLTDTGWETSEEYRQGARLAGAEATGDWRWEDSGIEYPARYWDGVDTSVDHQKFSVDAAGAVTGTALSIYNIPNDDTAWGTTVQAGASIPNNPLFSRWVDDDGELAAAVGYPNAAMVATETGTARGLTWVFREVAATPNTPASNFLHLYAKDKSGVSALYFKDDAGTETEVGSGGGGSLTVLDEGVSQGTATSMDFVGSGVSAAVAGSVATVTVSGGGGGGGEPGRSWLGV